MWLVPFVAPFVFLRKHMHVRELQVCKHNGLCMHVDCVLHTKMVEFHKVSCVKLEKCRNPLYSQKFVTYNF